MSWVGRRSAREGQGQPRREAERGEAELGEAESGKVELRRAEAGKSDELGEVEPGMVGPCREADDSQAALTCVDSPRSPNPPSPNLGNAPATTGEAFEPSPRSPGNAAATAGEVRIGGAGDLRMGDAPDDYVDEYLEDQEGGPEAGKEEKAKGGDKKEEECDGLEGAKGHGKGGEGVQHGDSSFEAPQKSGHGDLYAETAIDSPSMRRREVAAEGAAEGAEGEAAGEIGRSARRSMRGTSTVPDSPSMRRRGGAVGSGRQLGYGGAVGSFKDVAVPSSDLCDVMPSHVPFEASDSGSVLGRPYVSLQSRFVVGRREIGRGQFGVIYKCVPRGALGGAAFACKTIKKRNIETLPAAEDIRREVEALEKVRGHPGIVELNSTFEDPHAVHLVMQLCRHGDLFDHVKTRTRLSEPTAACILSQLLHALQHCHDSGVIHRDVKPENVLIYARGGGGGDGEKVLVKLGDFGVATRFSPGIPCTDPVGTAMYMSPELLQGSYGPAADVWSAGVVLYVMLSGALPFFATKNRSLIEAILHGPVRMEGPRWEGVSEGAKAVVRRMLEKDPVERATIQQIHEIPWMKKFNG
ncbi:unnamed protein product [Closterium sp. Yama58-4]|nr:unnamed protein product [Closterium sp. Yama58-4]